MNQTSHPFIPRRGSPLSGTVLERIISRYLTPISIGVALIGLMLVIVGPLRAMLSGSGTPTGNNGSNPAGQAQGGMIAPGVSDGVSFEDISRQLLAFTIIPDRPRKSVITYVVKPGDTLFGIAAQFGINPKTIFWSNAVLEDNVHMLQPGMELAVPPVDGVYYAADGVHDLQFAANEYQADVNAIIGSPYNELAGYTPTDVPPWGMKIVVPGGQRPFVWKDPVVVTTDTRTGAVVSGFMPGMGGSCASGIQGGGGTGAWGLPLNAYTVTQGFYDGHTGIDLAAPVGTPVYAADTGVVIFSGWNDWGYGILVVLDHGNGWTTYYAHLNSRSVGCGDVVSRGQYIGQVGTTGNSSGPHLHFEMRWGHRPDNPANYIGF